MGSPNRRKSRTPDATGRCHTTRFTRLDHRLLNSNAYRALSPNARSLLVELASLFNGKNNGSLYLSVRDAAARIGLVDLTATTAAFAELQDLGFIELMVDAAFRSGSSDTSRARCWRLTFEAGPGRKGPTNDYLEREPAPKTKARRRMESGLRALKSFRRAADRGKFPVWDSDTLAAFSKAEPGLPYGNPIPP